MFDAVGVDDRYEEVYTVPYQGLAAVVSQTDCDTYREMTRAEAVGHLITHQRVIEAVMEDLPILPLKFGTVLTNENQVLNVLAHGYTLFKDTLEKFAGFQQMEVVVLWNLQDIFERIAQEDAVVQLKSQIGNRLPAETLQERMLLGRVVQASLEKRRETLKDSILKPLRELAHDIVLNPGMDDSMVLNVALLVDHTARCALDQTLQDLDGLFEGKLHFRCVGPLPLYSFASIDVKIPSFEEIDQARCRLGLGQIAFVEDIRQAYHRMAKQLHPDRCPNAPETEGQMNELTKAYKLLLLYAASQPDEPTSRQDVGFAPARRLHMVTQPGRPEASEKPCAFERDAVERTVLISLQRQESQA